jgi:hypothetical protein
LSFEIALVFNFINNKNKILNKKVGSPQNTCHIPFASDCLLK